MKYLRLEEQYREYLGGLRWSTTEDLLEYEDGRTFAFNEEIAEFVQGFGSVRPLVHFGFILHLLEMLRGSRLQSHASVARLRHAYQKTGKSLRNAGVFCALLCSELPRHPERLDPGHISLRLRNPAWPIRQILAQYHDSIPSDLSPLGPAAFVRRILEALPTYSDLEIYSWLRHGHLPLEEPAQEVARQIAPPEARTLSGLIEELLERPRLAGVRPFVAQMVSALTLPPRRLAREEIPVGGYADVATHGQVEQILPSQFALDDLEFVRRYAERELLYFRREEPNQRTKQEMVVVLDQGVRTWGEVRLLLSAAVMALARQADRRRIPFLLRGTSMARGWIDPMQASAEALAEVLEASDLSPHPGYTLEWALEQPCTGARDIVLLTHPRNLLEQDVRAAIKRLTPEARLFTLSVDRGGSAAFDEIKRGARCPVRHFQVDLRRTDVAPLTPRERPSGVRTAWEGDVEPIGFPFCFGPSGRVAPHLFQFDLAGEWLLAPDSDGMLYAWKTDGSDMEILPR
ncbi:MAG TPA: hypothetical protein VGY58_11575, partial [Gemmataceae bacterium]|nr:hypothetical protein [Gemmataceae bacterium]